MNFTKTLCNDIFQNVFIPILVVIISIVGEAIYRRKKLKKRKKFSACILYKDIEYYNNIVGRFYKLCTENEEYIKNVFSNQLLMLEEDFIDHLSNIDIVSTKYNLTSQEICSILNFYIGVKNIEDDITIKNNPEVRNSMILSMYSDLLKDKNFKNAYKKLKKISKL